MTPERYQQIEQLYQEALGRSAGGERAAFLETACAGDEALRREVESLLAAYGKARSFLEMPPDAVAAEMVQQARSMAGRVLRQYQVRSLLGRGGMGEIYLVQDLLLARPVALKLLPAHFTRDADRMRRFVREAKAAAALSHPNVAHIYEIGEAEGISFIAMEYVQGQTLDARIKDRPLDSAEIVDVAIQVADALEEAHSKGIIHRDIKPANIMITPRCQVKVLDFGVAKMIGPERETPLGDASAPAKTEPGVLVGTVGYMSPEQALGQEVDPRTDIFSLGAVLYEMAVGRGPFTGTTTGQVLDQIIHAEPEAVAGLDAQLPAELARIIHKCLEKNRELRYSSVRELVADLRNLERQMESGTASRQQPAVQPEIAAASPSRLLRRMIIGALIPAMVVVGAVGIYLYVQRREAPNQGGAVKALVVLPFLNASANPDIEYLSDGIAESLINNLSQLPELKVIARNTAFRYKGKDVDLQKLGRELSVDTALTGRVQQRGDTLVVHADLVNLVEGSQLWGEKYNRKLTDLMAVEEEIAKAISEKIRPRLTAEVQHRLMRRSTDNPQAHQVYLRGRYFWNKRTKEALNQGIEYFQQAIELDPKYALAYTGLADSYRLLAYYRYAPLKENYTSAEAASSKALALDDELAEAHAALGALRLEKWDWLGAEKELKRAIALNPNYAPAHDSYGTYLNRTGHNEEAEAEFIRAQQLDPASAAYSVDVGNVLCQMGQYERGIAQLKESLRLDPNYTLARNVLGAACYLRNSLYQEAIDEFKQALAMDPTDRRFLGPLAGAHARLGNQDQALTILKELKERDQSQDVATSIAQVYIGLDDKDRAFEWLEKAYQRRSDLLARLKVAPMYFALRSDPRYAELVRRIGFPP